MGRENFSLLRSIELSSLFPRDSPLIKFITIIYIYCIAINITNRQSKVTDVINTNILRNVIN